jgi:hypothetical protein
MIGLFVCLSMLVIYGWGSLVESLFEWASNRELWWHRVAIRLIALFIFFAPIYLFVNAVSR